MNSLLEVTKDQYSQPIINTMGLSETMIFGLQMFVLGMLAVFAVLLLIMIALYVFKAVFTKKAEAPLKTAAPVSVQMPVASNTLSDEVVVAIAAAIAMAESESNGLKFRVVSVRRK